MLLIITSTGDRLFGFINIDDLEPLKKRFLVNFSQFLDAAHISTLNCDEMAGDRPRQPAYEIFSMKWLLNEICCLFHTPVPVLH